MFLNASMSSRKVVFVNRYFYPDHSATSQILADLAFDLAAKGVEVEVVTSRLLYDDPEKQLPAFEVLNGVAVHRVWTSRFGRSGLVGRAVDYLTFYASAGCKLWQRLSENTVAVVKTDPPLLSVVVAPVAKFRGAILVNWLQDLFPEVADELGVRVVRGWILEILRCARDRTLRAARTNVVLGSRMAALVRAAHVPDAQIQVIPNWADGSAIQPLAHELNVLRSDWGLNGRFVVGYSGNLGRAHEFDTFLDAAEALKGRSDIAFLFIGGGAQHTSLHDAVQKRGLQNMMFRPYQQRELLSQSLGAIDVHLVSLNPALEGLIVPSKFYGIAAAGRPTLFVGDVDGEIPRVLRSAACGFAVASGDGQGLAELIERLANDAMLCSTLGRNARRVLEEKFDRKLALAAWQSVLQ